MGAGLWGGILVLVLFNMFKVLMFAGEVNLLDVAAVGVLVVSLVVYVGLIGSGGSDVFGAGATTVAALRAGAMAAFVLSVTTLIVSNAVNATGAPGWLMAAANLIVGGYVLFDAIAAAKPGAAA